MTTVMGHLVDALLRDALHRRAMADLHHRLKLAQMEREVDIAKNKTPKEK